MKNLAGHPEATEWFGRELAEAGVRALPCGPAGEVRAAVMGRAELPRGFVLTVHRAWVYQTARIDPALPAALARAVNATPCDLPGTKYSGERGSLGAVCRAEGFAGGLPDDRIDDTDHWHIDAAEALAPFVRAVSEALGSSDVTAEAARAARSERWTNDMLDALATTTPGCRLHELLTTELLNNTRSADDPRVAALRSGSGEGPLAAEELARLREESAEMTARLDVAEGAATEFERLHTSARAVAGSWQSRAEGMEAALAAACAREAALRAIVEESTTPPTDEAIAAHEAAGGAWLVQWASGTLVQRMCGDTSGTLESAEVAAQWRGDGEVVRWWALDAERRPCAWPTPAALAPGEGASAEADPVDAPLAAVEVSR